MQEIYILTFRSLFHDNPLDSVMPYRAQIAQQAATLNCSIRLYIQAAMVGFLRTRDELMGHTENAVSGHVSAKYLTTTRARNNVKVYADYCRRHFGTFNVTQLDTVTDINLLDRDIATRMLNSEIMAAKEIINFKLTRGGEPEGPMYATLELHLDPHWLAIEPSYTKFVLEPYKTHKKGSPAQKHHRFNVLSTLGHLKRHRSAGRAVHIQRGLNMPEALKNVLQTYRHSMHDFEMASKDVTNAFEFWKSLARALAHVRCLDDYSRQMARRGPTGI